MAGGMIRLSELRDLVKRHPAPAVVGEMRELIAHTFSNLEFVEEGHKYYLPRPDGGREELVSVSSLISQFEQPTDWDAISMKYADKHGRQVEDVRRDWRETSLMALARGSKTHFFGEMFMNVVLGREDVARESLPFQITDDYIIPYCPKEEAVVRYWTDILSTGRVWPIMPETKVYTGFDDRCDFLFNYAGTFDILLAMQVGDDIKVALHDYKGLPLDMPIATTKGWRTMGSVEVGDEVFDRDGRAARVLHTSSVHYNSCYRVMFDDGLSVVADMEHRWLVEKPLGGGYEVEAVVTTADLYGMCNEPTGAAPVIRGHRPLEGGYADMLGIDDVAVDRRIVSMEPAETVPTRCIEVDSPTSTFCCGREMLVTHNTNAALTNDYCQAYGKMMLAPFDDMFDEALSHYNIQLSAYQVPLESIGVEVADRRVIWLRDDGTYEKVRVPDLTRRIRAVLADPDEAARLRERFRGKVESTTKLQ